MLVLPWTSWPEGYGHVPWWVSAPLVAAVVLLLVGVGGRRYTTWAGLLGGTAMVAGVVSFQTSPREEVELDGRTQERIRAHPWPGDVPPEWWLRLYPANPPAAPLACALAAAVVLVLCVVVLVRRQDPWMGPGPADGEGQPPTRTARRAMAAGLVGVLVGGLSGAGTAYGANELRMAALEPWWGPLAESVPVPEDRLHEGSVEWDRNNIPLLPEQPTRVSWQHDFAGPAALSTCGRDGRARATLVALEESAERSVIIGHDARDGTPRWSLTVHRQETAELTQVAVGEGCSVLVLIGTVLLAVDTYTGQVVGSSVLPRGGSRRMVFPRTGRGGVSAAAGGASSGAVRASGVRASGGRDGTAQRRRARCTVRPLRSLCLSRRVLRPRGSTGQLLVDYCSDLATVVNLPDLATPEELRGTRPPPYRVPTLAPQFAASETPVPAPPPGCSSGPVRIRSTSDSATVVETAMDCAGKGYRARTSISIDGFSTPEWTLSPEANVAPDLTFVRSRSTYLAEVWGDTVVMMFSRGFDRWWAVSPKPGDPVVGLADVDGARLLDGWQGPMDMGTYSPILALTRSGSLVTLAEFRHAETPERVRVLASSDVARQPCAGERGLLADKTSGTALVLCTTNDGTHVTAVTD
ncbi:hypothetical protein CFP66_08695 [Pseudonocardia sp. MH-G8]|nr:hypothetical protein CFP66_08695 [Pseudonocardia sp. MH-G8]